MYSSFITLRPGFVIILCVIYSLAIISCHGRVTSLLHLYVYLFRLYVFLICILTTAESKVNISLLKYI